ncbi:LysR family transcriptional regulator [Erwiniaceae bacterium BAC15a-03b]|uniref:LysR family transcriptional regulator n=1 Tax=Winslowiella arboricola TaxID=2978220 RepID=A0A9J6PXR1_9GAMM|nr:LysR family transcriptional regulator [Winslowiella arboricola]MCU5775012.1 LysR family transcriptional regulator [Winslowiella arboricola]MCU5780533.1 LysR family transcriptional regulator [Winslowiella arboricola]
MKPKWPQIEDFNVFLTVIRNNSFSGAAVELGLSNAYITKRIGILEDVLQVKLFYRNTRDIKLTTAGEVTKHQAEQLLRTARGVIEKVQDVKNDVTGSLHICSSFGFGKNHLTRPLSLFAKSNPKLKIKFTLTDIKLDLVKEGVDLEIMVGDAFNDRYYARRIADNKRVLCASPDYFDNNDIPNVPEDLSSHSCLFLQEKGEPFGVWQMKNDDRFATIRVSGDLSSNNGEVIMQWALDGHGIAFRSQWDARKYIESGQLIQILPDYYQQASVWAIYPQKLDDSIKTRKCVEFLDEYFRHIHF